MNDGFGEKRGVRRLVCKVRAVDVAWDGY